MSSRTGIALASVLAIGLQVMAVSTNEWAVKKREGVKLKWGLWKVCVSGDNINMCSKLSKDKQQDLPKTELNVVRAFAIISVLLVLIGTLCYFGMPAYRRHCSAFYGLAALCSLIAASVWVAKLSKLDGQKGDLGFSYWLFVIGGVVSAVTSGVLYNHGKSLRSLSYNRPNDHNDF